jgi:hypothetical protein
MFIVRIFLLILLLSHRLLKILQLRGVCRIHLGGLNVILSSLGGGNNNWWV